MATPYPHLPKAPISEALLDVQVVLPPDVSVETIEAFAVAVREVFPEERPRERITTTRSGTLEAKERLSTLLGKIFWSPDHTRAVQARIDGFTVNHVKSYDRWSVLCEQAKSLWPL